MCQHNLPCSIVYAHCLLPGRAFASLYVLLFLEKEAEIGGRDTGTIQFDHYYTSWECEFLEEKKIVSVSGIRVNVEALLGSLNIFSLTQNITFSLLEIVQTDV